MNKLIVENPRDDEFSSIFDVIRYHPYNEREYKFGMRVVDMLKASTFFDFIENPSYQLSHFNYALSRKEMEDLSIHLIQLKVYDHKDVLISIECIGPPSQDILGSVEFYHYTSSLAYPDLIRYEMVGKSRINGKDVVLRHWEGKFYESTLKTELLHQYGITPNMKIYKLIKNEVKKEISRRIFQYEMSNRLPRSFGERNFQDNPVRWDIHPIRVL